MDPEKSELLAAMAGVVNGALRSGADRAEVQALSDDAWDGCLIDGEQYFPVAARASMARLASRRRRREKHALRTERSLKRRSGRAFELLNDALAAAEGVNGTMVDVWATWLGTSSEPPPPFLGIDDAIGGQHVRVLMLLSLHARTVRIGTEILHLLRSGFPEGAAARARTMYELTVKMLVICMEPRDSGWELADRYYVSSQLEKRSKRELFSDSIDQLDARLRDGAVERWGEDLFDGPNNWAVPAVSRTGRERVSFKQLEAAAGAESLSHMYVEGNHAVHAGAMNQIMATDFRWPYLNNCRSEVTAVATGRVGQAVSFYLSVGTETFAKTLSTELREWDAALSCVAFVRVVGDANQAFRHVYVAARGTDEHLPETAATS